MLFGKMKAGGALRLFIDYRALNSNPVNNALLFPGIDELSSHLHGACIFSILDLYDGYH